MYNVTIYDKSKKIFKTYKDIHTVKYLQYPEDWISVTGEEILTHNFPCLCSYQLIGNNKNYSIDKSIVGAIEIESMT
ncbi:MAG: hypothetical protein K2O91_12020 [Lachnospiraceae bacterium]|nr:hypothetical protein [Lachnospiraceae bacterium]